VAAPIGCLIDGDAGACRQAGLGKGKIDNRKSRAPRQLSPTMRATAANGICWASSNTGASNSKVKPARLPTRSGSTSAALPSGSLTLGTRGQRLDQCPICGGCMIEIGHQTRSTAPRSAVPRYDPS
jgi:hypothetical protein